jgi:hypothetical protein
MTNIPTPSPAVVAVMLILTGDMGNAVRAVCPDGAILIPLYTLPRFHLSRLEKWLQPRTLRIERGIWGDDCLAVYEIGAQCPIEVPLYMPVYRGRELDPCLWVMRPAPPSVAELF